MARWGRRFLPLTFILAVVLGGFVVDASFPGLTDSLFRYPDRTYAIADIAVGLVSAMLIVSITMTLLIKNFDLERQGANRRLRDLSLKAQTDALTELGNRAWIELTLRNLASETESPLSVVLADIDHFKAVNDEFGHNTGDLVLQGVASVFRQMVRKTDLVGRYSGEEFILILPGTRRDEAALLAEKVRQRLMEAGHPSPAPRVTASFGVAEFQPGESLSELVGRADAALYQAKAAGRNRVVTAPAS